MLELREGRHMQDRVEPPVNEVALAVSVTRTTSMAGPRLGLVLGDLLDGYPKFQQVPPYEMPIELPLEKQPVSSVMPRIQFLGGAPDPRYWLTTDDEIYLLQIQPDYLALNWRRRTPDQDYVGYEELRDIFEAQYGQIDSSLKRQFGEELRPRQAELTYVNVIQPSALWHLHRDTHSIINIEFGDSGNYEQVAFSYSKGLVSESGAFAGRIHVSVQPAIDPTRQLSVLNLSILARSTFLEGGSFDSASAFLDLAHHEVRRTFATVVTPSARKIWGMQ